MINFKKIPEFAEEKEIILSMGQRRLGEAV